MVSPNITTPPSAVPPDQGLATVNIPAIQQQTTMQATPTTQTISHQTTPNQPVTTNATPTNTITLQHQQTTQPPTLKDSNNLIQTNVASQPLITTQAIVVLKTAPIGTSQEQQAPLALTTQPQSKLPVQTTSPTITQHQPPTIPVSTSANTITIQQQRPTLPSSIKDSNNLSRTPSITPQPQALITAPANIVAKTTALNPQLEQQAPLALITQPQTKTSVQVTPAAAPQLPPQSQAPITTIVTPVSTPNVKQEPTKYICCLMDNNTRCERVAGNASFSARIQKIVASKKMNFALDQHVRHTYICDHHKAAITVAKKSVPTARESKAAARNLAAASAANNNVNSNNMAPQHVNNYSDLAMNQTTGQHPVNMDMMTNQGRMPNNHTGMLISMPIRPGAQIAYGHYNQGPHPSQIGRLDHPMMTTPSFDNAGGDSMPSSSGGVEVDLQQLQVNTLRRYKRHFRVQTRPGLNKMQLAESLKHHFRTLPIIEKEAITYFVYIVKSSRNKLDHNPKAD